MRFRDWACLHYHLLWAYDGPVLPEAHAGTYTSPEASCWLIRKGHVTLTSAGREASAGPGQWAFVASPTRHQVFSPDAEILSLHFHLSWPGGEPFIPMDRTVVLKAASHPELEKAAQPIVRHVKRAFPKADAFLPSQLSTLESYLQSQRLLPVWLSAYLRALAQIGVHPRRLEIMDDRLMQGTAFLDRHPLSERFRESVLLKQVGLNRSRFDALFIAAHGTTPRRYLEKRRLQVAKDLLTNTASSVKEIAISLGFTHVSHFSLWFRRLTGTNASMFRNGKAGN